MDTGTHNKQGSPLLQENALTFHRYLARQVLQTVVGILVCGLLVIFAGRLLQYMQAALQGRLEAAVAFEAVLLKMPEFIAIFLPLAWVLGVYLVIGRMWAGNEMSAALFAFVSPLKMLCNTVFLSVATGIAVLVLSFWVVPMADERAEQVLFESRTRSALLLLSPGLFHQIGEDWEIHISDREGDRLGETLLIRSPEGGGTELGWGRHIDVALCGEAECSLSLNWPDGMQYARFSAEGELLEQVGMAGLHLPLLDVPVQPGERLYRELHAKPAALYLQWHLALPLFCLIAALMVLPLASVAPRQGPLHRLPVVLLLVPGYLVLLLAGREWLLQGRLSPFPGIWPVHLGFLALAFALSVLRRSGRGGF